MDRRKKPVVEYRDNNNLDMMVKLISDKEFVEAVQALKKAAEGLVELSSEQFSKLADSFAELAEKYGASADTMQTAIEMVKVDHEELTQ